MTGTVQKDKRANQRVRTGLVSSIIGEKTLSVVVDTLVKHPRYGKRIRQRTKLAVHDPAGKAGQGDVVEIALCRPISKTKSWRLVRVVRRPADA